MQPIERAWLARTLAAGALALVCLAPGPGLAQVEGTPRVVDGQTIEVAGQRFRLNGVVAPPLEQVCERMSQPYPCGKVARAQLWDLIGGRDVTCTPVPGAERAGDAVAATCTAGGASLNERMVQSGWAFADRAQSDAYAALEDGARQAGRGLWRSQFAFPGAPGRDSASQKTE